MYHYRIRYFPVMGVTRWKCMLLKIGGYQEEGWKKKGWLIHFSTPWRQPVKNLLIPSTWKKIAPPTWKIPQLVDPHPPVPLNTKFLFPQASKPKPLNWYRHIEKQHWDRTISTDRQRGLGTRPQPTVREIYKLDDIVYFGKFSKQISWKKKTL